MKLGITGGIGSGKTSVCRVFSILGIPVFSADDEARKIMDSEQSVIEKIKSVTRIPVYKNGTLDRQELARIAFTNKDLLAAINKVVHPAVISLFKEWADNQDSPYVILEAAILFESGAAESVDKVLTVVAPLEERIERVMRRNNLTREQILERINNQSDDETKIQRSDWVIRNSETDLIVPGIIKIHEEILKLTGKN
ncbi:MAG: dephospho-CoA kinase [Bacteroidales bacterium]